MTVLTIGLDLSLTSTGISSGHHTQAIRPRKLIGLDRMRTIRGDVLFYIRDIWPSLNASPLVAIEGPSYGTPGQVGQHERGGLWWYIVESLDCAGLNIAVVPPAVVKKYATGKGNAGKDEVLLAASRRFDWFSGGNDEADALWLAAIAAELLGEPLVQMPAAHRAGLPTKVTRVKPLVAA